ncbi:MAG: sensor histidine kinase [Acidimicrobiia bacterium]
MTSGLGQHLRVIAASRGVDVVGAGLLGVVGEFELWFSMEPSAGPAQRVVLSVVVALVTLSLVWRRQAPVAVLAVVFGSAAVGVASTTSGQGDGPFSVFLAVLVAVFSFGAYAHQHRQIVTGVAILSAGFAAEVLHDRLTDAETDFGFWIAVAVFWVLGRLFGERLQRVAHLEQRAVQMEQDRDMNARAAVADERARIARELHDVVAHSVSVMVIQAGAALHTLNADDVDTAEALGSIETAGRQALVELRHMLGILRRADDEHVLSPMPGIAQVTVLSEQMREAGLPVEVRVEGQPTTLPPGLDLAAYRIVQEALTNTLKHAGIAHASVTISYGAHALELEIQDDGRPGAPMGDGTGHGLVGMRERVSLYGGVLDVGRSADGGFAVRALLPLNGNWR